MIRASAIACTMALVGCDSASNAPEPKQIAADDVQSGYVFLTSQTQELQDDPFENPGYLWVDRGEQLFSAADNPAAPACASCHSDGLSGVAARYPAVDLESGELLNLEGRINQCRTKHQGLAAYPYESDALLSLTAYVAEQSQGVRTSVTIDDTNRQFYETGRDYFLTRRGQFNLSCQQCHTESWGKQLRGDTISQGHGNGFPAYRLEWQTLGSLHRRLRDCDTGVRAEPLPYGDDTYIALELYLAARAKGLPVETPAVRR
mgnify:CR=1 FL=1